MFVNVNFHTNAGKVGDSVRYVAHREEALPEGRTREIYGIRPRYRELRGDEAAIVRRLRPILKDSRNRASSASSSRSTIPWRRGS